MKGIFLIWVSECLCFQHWVGLFMLLSWRLSHVVSPPCLFAHLSWRPELHSALKCSFIHLSGGLDQIQLHVLLQTCRGEFVVHFQPHVSLLQSYSYIQIEQSSHRPARDAHCNFRKTHGPVKMFLFITHLVYGLQKNATSSVINKALILIWLYLSSID
jgi:hypothetical protein